MRSGSAGLVKRASLSDWRPAQTMAVFAVEVRDMLVTSTWVPCCWISITFSPRISSAPIAGSFSAYFCDMAV